MAVSLPQDVILFQIITWVPTKSAVRFKCVSKQWNSFLTSDAFKEMHNDRNHLEDQNILFLSAEEAMFYTIECETPPDNAPGSRPLPQFAARPPQYMCYMRILTSYHGLVCLRIEKNVPERKKNVPRDFDIILWNPVTTEYKRLSIPSNPDHMECNIDSGYGLYYSLGEDDYKLLVVTSGKVYIYSLKSDSWRKLDTKFLFQNFWTWRPGFCLSKYLYFLSQSEIIEGSMRFDTKAKTFHKIKTPPMFPHKGGTSITVQQGSIHYCAMYHYMIELWKYIADEDIWSKVVTYQLHPSYDICGLCPLHLMSNGNLLMIHYRGQGNHICQVDLIKKKYNKDKKDGHNSKCKDKSRGSYHDEYKLLYNSDFTVGYPEEVIIYTETFVSPNRYMK